MKATPELPRDASVGYCLSAFLPFIVSHVVLSFRGAELVLVLSGGPLFAIFGYLIGAMPAFLILEHSRVVRERLGAVAITMAATIAAFLIALLNPYV